MAANDAEVQQLREMFPTVDESFLAAVLLEAGDLNAAIDTVLSQLPADEPPGPKENDMTQTQAYVNVNEDTVAEGGGGASSSTRPIAPPSTTVADGTSKTVQRARRLLSRSLSKDILVPLDKVAVPPYCAGHDKTTFSYGAVKTKANMSAGFGPAVGSTWSWFLVGELIVKSAGTRSQVTLRAEKFQAGWASTAAAEIPEAKLRSNQRSVVQAVLDGAECKAVMPRRGVPDGFSHSWNYSDSEWSMGSGETAPWPTEKTKWKETKGKDRWRVEVTMEWLTDVGLAAGHYLLVADQRAEKLNRNQYATAMRGLLLPVRDGTERRAALQGVLDSMSLPVRKRKAAADAASSSGGAAPGPKSEGRSAAVKAKARAKVKAALRKPSGLATGDTVELPFGKVLVPPYVSEAGAAGFSYGAVKTKATLAKGGFGPIAGSTWSWFIVAEMSVKGGSASTEVQITGDKFQAGWAADTERAIAEGKLRSNQQLALQAVLEGNPCTALAARRGVPEGFSHQWNYADSEWTMDGAEASAWSTESTTWKENKLADRWKIDVKMVWKTTDAFPDGTYLLVADQRAEKLNRNQYATAMRGALLHFDGRAERNEALRRMLRCLESSKTRKTTH